MKPASWKLIFSLVRPGNLVLTLLGTLIGGVLGRLAGGDTEGWRLPLAALSSGLIAAGGYAFNDASDKKEDSINRPQRPVASGGLSRSLAGQLGLTLIVAGFVMSWFVSFGCGLMALTVCLLLLGYSAGLKSTGLGGNLIVALVAAAPFPFGALAVGKLWAGLLALCLAAPMHLAREILKDVEDIEGDRAAGRKTFPLVHSEIKAVRLAGLVMLILAMFIPVPYFAGWIGWQYLAIAGLLTALPLAFFGGGTIAYPEAADSRKMQRLLKWLMLPGMAAIVLGMICR